MKATIVVESAGYVGGYEWRLTTDGVKAHDWTETEGGAWRAARRRLRKIRRLRRTLDIKTLIDV